MNETASRIAVIVVLAVPLPAATAAPVPDSGQLLQQTPPPAAPVPSSKPGLTIEQPAAGQAPSSVSFLVRRIEITGNTLVPASALRGLVEASEGRSLTLADLEALAAGITKYYQDHGFLLARAYVPTQTLSDGTVRIVVLEARYGAVSLSNTSRVSDARLLSILAPLQAGQPVVEDSLQRSLLLLSDVPGTVVNSVLAPGAALGTSDLRVSAGPGAVYGGAVAVDDAGNRYTGRARLSVAVSAYNPLGIGDVLSVSALTSGSGLNYGRLGYQALVSGAGTTASASISALKYRLGHALSDLRAHGTAEVASATVMQPLIRSTAGNLFAQLGYDGKRLRDEIDATGIHANRRTHALTLTVAGDERDATGILNGNVAVTYGHLAFDDQTARNIDAVTARTRGNYGKYALSLARLQRLDDLTSLYLAFNGQVASKNLDSSEQFFVGGPNSVRAYDVGAVGGAVGGLASAELRRDVGLPLSGRWQAIAFVESGVVRVYRNVFAAGPNTATLSGAGFGLNWSGAGGWTASAAAAKPIGAVPGLVGHTKSARLWVEVRKAFSGGGAAP